MRIAILTDSIAARRGGAIGIAWQHAALLAGHGHDVTVVTTTQSRAEAGQRTQEGMAVLSLYSDYPIQKRPQRAIENQDVKESLTDFFFKKKPDIVHAHNIHTYISYAALTWAKDAGARVFLTAHDVIAVSHHKLPGRDNYHVSEWELLRQVKGQYRPFRNKKIAKHLLSCEKLFAVSDALRRVFTDNGIGSVGVIHNAIDALRWRENPGHTAQFKKKYGLVDRPVFFAGGRMSIMKGSKQLILALRAIAKKHPDVRLVLGSRMETAVEQMRTQAQAWNIEDNLVLPGWLSHDNLCAAYYASSVVVVPSLCFDSFPSTNLEAFACHKPIVATNFGGSNELVEHGKTGYIVDPHDTDALTRHIDELLSDQKKAVSFGEDGFKCVQKNFSPPTYYSELIDQYS